MQANKLAKFNRISFSQLLLRWKSPHPFASCYWCIADDLTDLGMFGIYPLPQVSQNSLAVTAFNFTQIFKKLEYFCRTKLRKDPLWPIPMQCCVLAAILRTCAAKYSFFKQTNKKYAVLEHDILSMYNRYYTKWEYPRFYAMFLYYTKNQNNDDDSLKITEECINLLRYRLKLLNHKSNDNDAMEHLQIQQALDNCPCGIFCNPNAIVTYINYCKMYITDAVKIREGDEPNSKCINLALTGNEALYQLFQDLFKLQSQFDIDGTVYSYKYNHNCNIINGTIKCETCRWKYNTTISGEIGQCCAILLANIVVHYCIYELLSFVRFNDKQLFQSPKDNPNQKYDLILSLLQKFVCTYSKLLHSINQHTNIDPTNYTNIKNYKHGDMWNTHHNHDHPQIGSDHDIWIVYNEIHKHLNLVVFNLQIALSFLSIHYLVTQPRNEETLTSALLAAKYSRRCGRYTLPNARNIYSMEQTQTIGDCKEDTTLIIECCIYFIREDWQKYDEILSKIGTVHGIKSDAFECCNGLKWFKNESADPVIDRQYEEFWKTKRSNMHLVAESNQSEEILKQFRGNVSYRYSGSGSVLMVPWKYRHIFERIKFNQRWDSGLQVIAKVFFRHMVTFVYQSADKVLHDEYQRKSLLYKFIQPEGKTCPTIEFLSNLCQLKQCYWKKCKRKDVKLRRCKKCKKVLYCSKLCQKKHWINGHREMCVFS